MKNDCKNEPNWQTFFIMWSNLIPITSHFTSNDKIFVFKIEKNHIFAKENLEIIPLLLGFGVRKNERWW